MLNAKIAYLDGRFEKCKDIYDYIELIKFCNDNVLSAKGDYQIVLLNTIKKCVECCIYLSLSPTARADADSGWDGK